MEIAINFVDIHNGAAHRHMVVMIFFRRQAKNRPIAVTKAGLPPDFVFAHQLV